MDSASPSYADRLQRLGWALAERRHACGLTQGALAERLGISDKAIARWESGERDLRVSSLLKLADALQTSPEALLASDPRQPPPLRTVRKTGPRQGLAQLGWRSVPRSTPGAVPIHDLLASAGKSKARPSPAVVGWALPSRGHPREEGLFLARVAGESMQPKYRDGQWLLFATYKESMPQIGQEVLVRVADATGLSGWLVKRVSALREDERGRAVLTLHSYHPDFADQQVILDESGDVCVFATVRAAL